MSLLILSVVFGIITASVIAIASVGLTLQFGVTNFVNFAYGGFLTIGAYLVLLLSNLFHMNVWLAMVIACIITGLLSVIANRIVVHPFTSRRASLLTLLVVTFGLSLIIDNTVQAIWGPDFQKYTMPQGINWHLGIISITSWQVMVIVIAAVLLLGIHVMLKYSKLGKAMRAMSDDTDLARVSGIKVAIVTDLTWFVTGILAGVAGFVLALNVNSFTPALGSNYLFIIFAAVILGGIGRPYGAMAGALVIGLAMEISPMFMDSAYKQVVAFAILILVLLFCPEGIFTSRGRV